MRSVILSLLVTVTLSHQQQTDISDLCSALSTIHYKIFPLSSEIKKSYCKAERYVCSAFEMFASNDFAKEVVVIKEKLGCYPDRPSEGMMQSDLCNSLRVLPDTSKKSLYELYSRDQKRMSTFKPLLAEMRVTSEEWLMPILEQYC